MTPSLRKLKKLVGIWSAAGPLLLVAGMVFVFAYHPLVRGLAATALVIGGILLLGAVMGKVATLVLQTMDERSDVLATDAAELTR